MQAARGRRPPANEASDAVRKHARPPHGLHERCERDADESQQPRRPAFNVREDGSVLGKWVRFVPDASGAILDYTSNGPFSDRVIFTEIRAANWNAENAKSGTRGPAYGATDGTQRFVAFNAPNAAFGIATRVANTYTLVAAQGLALDLVTGEDGRKAVEIGSGDHKARLAIHGDATFRVDGQTITAELEEKSGLIFRIQGYPPAEEQERRALAEIGDQGHRENRPPIVEDGSYAIVADGSDTIVARKAADAAEVAISG